MSIRPLKLPKVRAQTIRRLADLGFDRGDSPFMLPGDDRVVDRLVTHLRAADLYWISDDMTALSVHAGEQLAAARWATADRPSPIGLAVFDGGLGMADVAPGIHAPVQALAWGPGPGSTLIVWHLLDGPELLSALPGADVSGVPPLLAVREDRLPVTDEPVSLDDLPAHKGMRPSRTIVAALAAAWHLMQQPQLADRTMREPSRADARALRRAALPDDGVTLVTLRRQYTPTDRDPDAGTDGRRYRHRWVVSGHWRNQPYGPGRSKRRQTWIPSYVKGPEGAPLLVTEKVNVWRR
ncbi:hypothetical protein ACFQWA_11840 [Streptomyces thermogriseus]|uniref:Uncharacterized protein n=1 Tax=Streptomyces thermogriseus TaxID=75292 RepID=A0ABN1SXF5_9ACTN